MDLLNLTDQGGCSAKLSASELNRALANLPKIEHKNLLVDIETHDDAGVFKIRDDYALVLTTDFFPPVCSDPYDFGQIAAANALSDVYAMGGQVLTALNLVMFPADLPMDILQQILAGGQDKVAEAGGIIAGGHTIAGDTPVYGLAVTGWVHPDKIVTNAEAKEGDVLILTKPIGTGSIISAKKNDLVSDETYMAALTNMKLLNDKAATVMSKYGIRAATDITGYGLLGHALKMALGSGVSFRINAIEVPSISNVIELIDMGCIPGAAFRNQEFAAKDCEFDDHIDYNHKMLLLDAQTSGGLLISAPQSSVNGIVKDLIDAGYHETSVIGEVIPKSKRAVIIT